MDNSDPDLEDLGQFGGLDKNNLAGILNDDDDNQENPILTIKASPYMSSPEIESILKKNSNKFNVFSINLDSIHSKFDLYLLPALKSLADQNLFFDAICIQESHLTESADLSLLKIPGYHKPISQGKTCGNKGGLVTYVRDTFKCKKRFRESFPGLH